MNINRQEAYNILEYILISDKISAIRKYAAFILFHFFPKKSIKPIIWAIQHDNSIEVLKTIHDMVIPRKHPSANILISWLDKRLANIYNIVPKEAQVLLELDFLKIKKKIIHKYKILINKKRIVALEIPGWHLNKLPSNIGNLTKLKLLNLWDNNLHTLPSSLRSLKNLESLYLDWNNFSTLPPFLSTIKTLKKISLTNNVFLKKIPFSLLKLSERVLAKNYVSEGVIKEDAAILGLLEIIIGQRLKVLQENEVLLNNCASHYRLNDDGRVIGIFIYGYYFFQLAILPSQICELSFLEELVIRDQVIKTIPESICKLSRLYKIDLMRNHFKEILKIFLTMKSLQKIDLSYNYIDRIPKKFSESNKEIWI